MNQNNYKNYINQHYYSDNTQTKAQLFRLWSYGALSGTGKMCILPIDQGFEHGPHRSFSKVMRDFPEMETSKHNPFDPSFYLDLAQQCKFNALVAPLGILEAIHYKYCQINSDNRIPTILKLNSNNYIDSQSDQEPNQTITASVEDAIRLKCSGVGFTIYPGSGNFSQMMEELREVIKKAKEKGLIVIVWAYPRGKLLSNNNITAKEAETSIDIVTYASHMACLAGAHIVKVKLPQKKLFYDKNLEKNFFSKAVTNHNLTKQYNKDTLLLASFVNEIRRACFNGKRLVIFSGGKLTDDEQILQNIIAIKLGGGNGSIIGRNLFQRPMKQANDLAKKIIQLYQDKTIY